MMLRRLWLVTVFTAVCALGQATRIVSTFPSITETLFALGAGDRVVGVSTYCRYPPAALSLPKIGTYLKPDPEKIALLQPDLVIIQKQATGLAERLSALGIRHAEVTGGSLPEVYSMISDIGKAAGLADAAEKLNHDIHSQLDAIRDETRHKPQPVVLMIVGREPGTLTNLIAVGPSTYLGALLEIAGGRNGLTDTAIGYPHISLETVMRMNPAVILDLSMMGDHPERLREPWMSHRELSAVRSGSIFGLTSQALVTPGPRVVEAVQLIREKLRPKDAKP